MALSTTAIPVNRATSNIVLPKPLLDDIWGPAQEESVFMRLAQRMEMPGSGVQVQMIASDATAAWTTESTEKYVSNATFSNKTIVPFKLTVIEMMSKELVRDLPRLYDELVRRLPNAIAKKFDETIAYGVAPGTGFDVLTSATACNIAATTSAGVTTSVYDYLVNAYTTVGNAGFQLDGWAFAPQAMGTLLGAVDGNGRPLLIDSANTDGGIGRIFGADVYQSRHVYKAGAAGTGGAADTPNLVGFAGDWTQAYYGIVDGIHVDISEEATINDGTNQVNLWQRNMAAVRVEAEVAFAVRSSSAFVRLTTPYSA